MRVINGIAILFIVVLFTTRPAQAQVLYGVGLAPNSDPLVAQPSYLYEIDPATAQVTPIGPIGFSYVYGMDVDPNTEVIYATAYRPAGGGSGHVVLLTINPATGQGTELMSWAFSGDSVNSEVAVRPSDGAIFVGWGNGAFARAQPPDNELTNVPGAPVLGAMSFDFSADDRIWWTHLEGNIFWRNLATGASGPPGDVYVACCDFTFDSMSFQPNTDSLFVTGESGNAREKLFTLNPTTGAVVEIGMFHPEGGAAGDHLDIFALAWAEEPDPSAGPISLWRAEGDAVDSVDDNDGTLENGATFGPGKAGMAFRFDGVDDQVTVPHDASLNPRVQMSISAWVNTSSPGHGRPIAQMRTTGNTGGYTFETTGSPFGPDIGLQWVIWINGGAKILQTPVGVLQIGLWHHVAATYDGTTMRIFVDGVEKASATFPGAIDLAPLDGNGDGPPFVIGRNVVIPSFAWHGSIDELAIYDRALTAAQIVELFDNGGVPNVDSDGDGVFDAADNCPAAANPDQIDSDGDGAGNVCDPDDDNDGLADGSDNCVFVANPEQADTDGDGTGNACDIDDDNDGILDGTDNCVLVVNPDQTDTDTDGAGNACDADDDNDGVLDGTDNCMLVVNPAQTDTDGDGIGDDCDAPVSPNGKIVFARDHGVDGAIFVMNTDGSNQTQVTFPAFGASDSEPRWSPDGTRIVFSRFLPSAFKSAIFVVNADGTGETQLAIGDGDALWPAWSPDGTKIVFVRSFNGPRSEIVVVNADGSGQRTLVPGIVDSEPDWSPDGSKIVFVRRLPDGPLHYQLVVIDPNGSLLQMFDTGGFMAGPRWSPDGSEIVLSRRLFIEQDTYLTAFNVSTGALRRLTSSDDDINDSSPSFSPDGTKIVFERFGTNRDVFSMDARGCVVTPDCELLPLADSTARERFPDWQRLTAPPPGPDVDGDGVWDVLDNCPAISNRDQADANGDGVGDVCDQDDDGVLDVLDNCLSVANPSQADADSDGQGDACDPDDDNDTILDVVDNCSLIANADQRDGDGDGIGDACDPDNDNDGVADAVDNCLVVANPDQTDTDGEAVGDACDPDDDNDGVDDGSDNCPLIANPAQTDSDGDGPGDACDLPPAANGKIAFVKDFQIFVMNADGSDQTQVTFSLVHGEASSPRWSPDGTRIVFSRGYGGGTSWIFVVNADGTGETQLALVDGDTPSPAWSPDGAKIVFVQYFDILHSQIITMNVDGSGLRRLTMGTSDLEPDWSPDGSKIVFVRNGPARDELITINPNGVQLQVLMTGGFIAGPRWSPDGSEIVFSGGLTAGSASLVALDVSTGATRLLTSPPSPDSSPSFSPDGTKIVFERFATSRDVFSMDAVGCVVTPDCRLLQLTVDPGRDRFPDWQRVPLGIPQPDTDIDGDGIANGVDNCPSIANPNQQDTDGDGLGDACDVEPPGVLQFSSATYSGTEDQIKGVVVTVVRTGGAGGKVSVDFKTADGTAVSGQVFDEKLTQTPAKGQAPPEPDYLTASGRLVFNDGETEKSFRVLMVDDGLVDPNETIQLMLSDPRGGATLGSPSTATMTIVDNDPNVSFEVAQSSGAEALRNVDVAVTLSAIGSSPVMVAYSVTGGTAAADDYQLSAGTLTFSPPKGKGKGNAIAGAVVLTQSIQLQIANDTRTEPNETVVIELSNPTGAVLGRHSRFTYTILANDETVPDNSGNTTDTAGVLDLAARPRQKVSDSVSRTDSDLYRVHLNAGEFLALDVDPAHQGLSSSEMVILDSDGVTPLATIGGSKEPDTGKFTNHPAYGFTAPHSGNYFIRVQTGDPFGSNYSLELHRVAVADPSQNPAVLDEPGPMFASLNGDVLSLTGPTGYGFSLIGNWNKSSTALGKTGLIETTYTMLSGTRLTLRSVLGDIPLGGVVDTVTIRTRPSRWGATVGAVDGPAIPIRAGIPFGALTGDINTVFGAYFDYAWPLPRAWEIRLGGNIADTTEFNHVLEGVPYLMFNGNLVADATFGAINVNQLRADVLMVINPVDPSFGVRFDSNLGAVGRPSWHFSVRGFVPSRPNVIPDAPGAITLTHFYGHALGNWRIPVIHDLMTVNGMATVDLDANDDGTLELDRSHASDLYAGEIAAGSPVMKDINIGFNGAFTFHYNDRLNLTLPKVSIVYSGLKDGLWVKAVSDGLGGLPWEDSPFSELALEPDDTFEGELFGDGDFFVRVTSTLKNLPGDGEIDFEFTISNSGISAEVGGRVEWTGTVPIKGVDARCTAAAGVGGSLDIEVSGASADYGGSLRIDGSVKCYFLGNKVASAEFNLSGEISGDLITVDLPYLNNESFHLP